MKKAPWGDQKPEDTFVLYIGLGDAAMRHPRDVAQALVATAQRLLAGEETGKIFDINGNSVGKFEFNFEEDEDEEDGDFEEDEDEEDGG